VFILIPEMRRFDSGGRWHHCQLLYLSARKVFFLSLFFAARQKKLALLTDIYTTIVPKTQFRDKFEKALKNKGYC
jgi:hypothetical protein